MKPEELKALLDYHDNLYYNQDDPEISDIEYDALKAQYLLLTGEEEYSYVPGTALFNKIKHTSPILSLDKVKITEEEKLRNEIIRLGGKVGIVIEPKFDGLTIVVYPEDTCVTRGDGEIGEDVTENCKSIKEIKAIRNDRYPMRTEVLMKKSVFEKLNKEREEEGLSLFKNPRNAAAGMLRNKDPKKVKGLTAYAYDAIGYELNQTTMLSNMQDMNVTPHWFFKDPDEAIDFIKNFDRNSLDYEIDGLVIKSNHAHSLDKFGITGHHPKNAIAVKFVAEEKWAELIHIKWEVGRTGKVVPVAHFEPIELMGSTVSKATLHNIAYIKALGLEHYISDLVSPKTKVKITKANDIIPAVIAVEQPSLTDSHYICSIHAPERCPDCDEVLERVNNQVFCRNNFCKERMIAGATNLASRSALDIAGLSEETIRKMYDALEDKDYYGYTFPLAFYEPEYLLELDGFAEKSAAKLAAAIDNATKEVPLSRFLTACGIPLLGKSTAKLIAKNFKSFRELEEDLDNKAEKLLSLNGVGKELVASMKDNWTMALDLCLFIQEINIVSEYQEPKIKPADQKTFVVTGTLEHSRSYYTKLIEDSGHKASSSISKKTFCVLVGEDAGPKKLEKIAELGIKTIITEEELKELL